MSKFCSECGSKTLPGGKFCSECGEPLVASVQRKTVRKNSSEEVEISSNQLKFLQDTQDAVKNKRGPGKLTDRVEYEDTEQEEEEKEDYRTALAKLVVFLGMPRE